MRLYYLLQFFKGQIMFITQGKLLVFAFCGIRYRNVVNIIMMNIQQRDKKVQGYRKKKDTNGKCQFRIERTTLGDFREESRLKVEKITRKRADSSNNLLLLKLLIQICQSILC